MFHNNNRFGMNEVFADYLGIQDLVVPGEIQHGYWYSERWEKKRSSQFLFFKTFLWGGIFANKMKAQRPGKFEIIGDPFLYANLKPLDDLPTSNKEVWVLYPRFSSSLPIKQREADHIDFMNWVISNGVNHGSISFHPSEKVSDQLKRVFKDRGFEVINPIRVGDPKFLQKKRDEILSYSGVITNYLGPHVFRATLLGKLALIDDRIELENFKSEYRQVIQPFLMRNENKALRDHRLEIAQLELGLGYVRSRDFLHRLFSADRPHQVTLKILKNAKDLIAGLGNIRKSTSIEEGQLCGTFWECPHCYSSKRLLKITVENLFCQNCYRRFLIGREITSLDDKLSQ